MADGYISSRRAYQGKTMDTLFGAERKSGWSWRVWLFILSPILVIGTCSTFAFRTFKFVAPAQDQTKVFHERLNAQDLDAIFDNASQVFQSNGSRDSMRRYFQTMYAQLGACSVPDKAASFSTNSNSNGTTVRLQYHLKCERGPLDEVVTFSIEDGIPKLSGFQASVPFELK